MNRSTPRLLFCLFLAGFVLAPAARAGLDIDFGASVRLDDRTDIYLAVSSRYFDEDEPFVRRQGMRYRNPDDLAVALFIARHSGRSADAVWDLRRKGLDWWEISVRLGIPTDRWFVETRRNPGPPYGKAYGYWKKHRKNPSRTVVLSDDDCRNLVAVRLVHDYFGVSVEAAMEWRSSGQDLRYIVADEYRRRHGKAQAQAKNNGGKGKGKSKKNR
jgi:hypothetical protein